MLSSSANALIQQDLQRPLTGNMTKPPEPISRRVQSQNPSPYDYRGPYSAGLDPHTKSYTASIHDEEAFQEEDTLSRMAGMPEPRNRRFGGGPISMGAGSIPDLNKSVGGSREEDMHSIPHTASERGAEYVGGGAVVGGGGAAAAYGSGIGTIETAHSRRARTLKPPPSGGSVEGPGKRRQWSREARKPPLGRAGGLEDEETPIKIDIERTSNFGGVAARSRIDPAEDDALSAYAPSVTGRRAHARSQIAEEENLSEIRSMHMAQSVYGGRREGAGERIADDIPSRRGGRTPGGADAVSRVDTKEEDRKETTSMLGIGGASPSRRKWGKVAEDMRVANMSAEQRAEKDELDSLKKQIEEEESALAEVHGTFKKAVGEMKERHRKDIETLRENNKRTLDMLGGEKKQVLEELSKKLDYEKEKIAMMQKSDLDTLDRQHQTNLENLRRVFEQQNDALKRQIDQQVEISALSKDLQSSAGNLETLLQQQIDAKEDQLKERELSVLEKEKTASEREAALAMLEQEVEEERRRAERVK